MSGVSAGEMNPPTLLPTFMMPPAVPVRVPSMSIMVAQNGPSTLRTHAVASASANVRVRRARTDQSAHACTRQPGERNEPSPPRTADPARDETIGDDAAQRDRNERQHPGQRRE